MCHKFNVKVNSTEFQHYFATIFSFALATQHKFKRKNNNDGRQQKLK